MIRSRREFTVYYLALKKQRPGGNAPFACGGHGYGLRHPKRSHLLALEAEEWMRGLACLRGKSVDLHCY